MTEGPVGRGSGRPPLAPAALLDDQVMIEDSRRSVERVLARSRRRRRIVPSLAAGSVSLLGAGGAGVWVTTSIHPNAAAAAGRAASASMAAAAAAASRESAAASVLEAARENAALRRDLRALDNVAGSIAADQRVIVRLPRQAVAPASRGAGTGGTRLASQPAGNTPAPPGAVGSMPSPPALPATLPALPPLPALAPVSIPSIPTVQTTTGATHVVP